MYKFLKRTKGGLGNLFINSFINSIPSWNIRRFLYKALGMKIGKNSRINMHCIIMKPWNIIIGEDTMVNEYVVLDGRGGLEIGDSCSISMYSVIYSASHFVDSPVFQFYAKRTVLKNCCWVGAGAIVLPGTYMDDYSVLAANSIVKGECEKKGIYSGVPAVKIRERKIDSKYKLDLSVIGFFV